MLGKHDMHSPLKWEEINIWEKNMLGKVRKF